jgi:acetylornithine deacetylase/succinyl-diaminopimelate desuccinylase-like protein
LEDPIIYLLQTLIRNECVNNGSASSGHEERSVRTLTEFFGVEGIVVEPSEGRQSLVYRIQGTDPTFSEMSSLFHGDDERVSIESVLRTTSLYESILEQFGEHSQ